MNERFSHRAMCVVFELARQGVSRDALTTLTFLFERLSGFRSGLTFVRIGATWASRDLDQLIEWGLIAGWLTLRMEANSPTHPSLCVTLRPGSEPMQDLHQHGLTLTEARLLQKLSALRNNPEILLRASLSQVSGSLDRELAWLMNPLPGRAQAPRLASLTI